MNGLSLTRNMDEITVVFAHPDDELIYFYQILQQLKPKRLQLICVTGQFTKNQAIRLRELAAAATQLGGELTNLGLEDLVGQPLDRVALLDRLSKISVQSNMPVFTHGPFGEYGHLHHVDVFRAVLQCFPWTAWCISGPLASDYQCCLDEPAQAQKRKLISSIYASQNISGFATARECLTQVKASAFADVLFAVSGGPSVAPAVATAFVEHMEQLYFGGQTDLPAEARTVTTVLGKEWVDQRIRPLLRQWKQWLMLLPE
jgi:hypothetical protein